MLSLLSHQMNHHTRTPNKDHSSPKISKHHRKSTQQISETSPNKAQKGHLPPTKPKQTYPNKTITKQTQTHQPKPNYQTPKPPNPYQGLPSLSAPNLETPRPYPPLLGQSGDATAKIRLKIAEMKTPKTCVVSPGFFWARKAKGKKRKTKRRVI